ncbi:MAG: alanine dehydrogenase [Cyclobacteriaceae bacterium]|nr:alanine dehydrogenase [Cyclobacteriaceae bacterium]
MKKIRIGLAREGKIPPDNRVALTPWEVIETQTIFPSIEIFCQSSPYRCFSDESYKKLGIPVVDSLELCDVILGIKEFPVRDLLEGKTYFFFSHTIKKQAYNRNMLCQILKKNIRLVDYECLTDIYGKRVIAFGRFAGIVGAYNAFWGYGKKYNLYHIRRALECDNYIVLKNEYRKIGLPPVKIVLTGHGSVGHGAREVIDGIGIKEVTVSDFLNLEYKEAVYVQLHSRDYYKRFDGGDFDREEFHRAPHFYRADFFRYARVAELFLNGTFWDVGSEPYFTTEQLQSKEFNIRLIADISCDVNGPIPSTIRTSTIHDPYYDYNPSTGTEEPAFCHADNISVMAVDNLPNELPREASNSFGRILIEKIFPNLVYGDENEMIRRATITLNGKLTPRYKYLQDYVDAGK